MAESRGRRIKKTLDARNMTNRDLANRTGISEVTISRYVHDQRVPKSDVLAKIAQALETSMDYLETGEESRWTKQRRNW